MKLAFFAPMKPPDDPVPSGDRTIGRNLIAALEHAGAQVDLASRFRCRDGKGDAALQDRLMREAEAEADRVTAAGNKAGWRAWVTYHNYYKAPDLLGPLVSARMGIPYLQIESTRARKRLGGAWDAFAKRAEAAADHANLIFYFTGRDAKALAAYAPAGQQLMHLRPFLSRTAPARSAPANRVILCAGMMRVQDKLASYRLVAETLHQLQGDDWQLRLAGDGPARADVERLMMPFRNRVRFLGALEPGPLEAAYGAAAIFFWPGVNEAIGMTYLEAQAAGLAIVAQDRPGLRDVLPDGDFPASDRGTAALAERLDLLLRVPSQLADAQQAARENMSRHHLLPTAAASLKNGLSLLGVCA